jgi:hypothetical protein
VCDGPNAELDQEALMAEDAMLEQDLLDVLTLTLPETAR